MNENLSRWEEELLYDEELYQAGYEEGYQDGWLAAKKAMEAAL